MYEDITDSSNPFNTEGISAEVRALLLYLQKAKKATGVDVVATCTTDHPAGATRHLQQGTNGRGLAIDCRLRTRGLDIHFPVFKLFLPVERYLYELIYSGAKYNIKAGNRVSPYAVSGHHDHVHVAVNKGILLNYPTPTTTPNQSTQEDGMAVFSDRDSDNLEAIKNYLVDQQKQNAEIIELLKALIAK